MGQGCVKTFLSTAGTQYAHNKEKSRCGSGSTWETFDDLNDRTREPDDHEMMATATVL